MDQIKTQRNKEILVINGYGFYCEKKVNHNRIYWKCRNYYDSRRCGVRIITQDGQLISSKGEHNHAPSASELEVIQTKSTIRKRAIASHDSPTLVIAEATATINKVTVAKLPPLDSLRRTIRDVRQRESDFPKRPSTLIDLNIPADLKITKRNEPFLLYDSGAGNDRILIFSTQQNLSWLETEMWGADGTFDSVPQLFAQLYTIHPLRDECAVPAVFALLPDKRETTYIKFLNNLLILNPRLKPRVILTDFEKAALNAFHLIFPDAVQRGCFFHFSQCIWRKVLI